MLTVLSADLSLEKGDMEEKANNALGSLRRFGRFFDRLLTRQLSRGSESFNGWMEYPWSSTMVTVLSRPVPGRTFNPGDFTETRIDVSAAPFDGSEEDDDFVEEWLVVLPMTMIPTEKGIWMGWCWWRNGHGNIQQNLLPRLAKADESCEDERRTFTPHLYWSIVWIVVVE
jgi:hypothetical protein